MKNLNIFKIRTGRISLGLMIIGCLTLETMAWSSSRNLSFLPLVSPAESPMKILHPQESPIKGTVMDQKGNPIPGATISVRGTTIGTATDLDGNFSINAPEGSTLVVSFIGFDSQTIVVGNQTVLSITLIESTATLQEVVVVVYCTQEKVNLTGAIGFSTSERLVSRPIALVVECAQGVKSTYTVTKLIGESGF